MRHPVLSCVPSRGIQYTSPVKLVNLAVSGPLGLNECQGVLFGDSMCSLLPSIPRIDSLSGPIGLGARQANHVPPGQFPGIPKTGQSYREPNHPLHWPGLL